MPCTEGRMSKALIPYEPGSRSGMIHPDHLGTPQKMTDGTGTVVWSAYYKAFGAATITVSTITNNLRFPGQYFDTETGLNYNFFRDYNPAIGRYVEPDPLNLGSIHIFQPQQLKKTIKLIRAKWILKIYQEDPRRQHLYLYVLNNPTGWIDPRGKEVFFCGRPPLIPEAEWWKYAEWNVRPEQYPPPEVQRPWWLIPPQWQPNEPPEPRHPEPEMPKPGGEHCDPPWCT